MMKKFILIITALIMTAVSIMGCRQMEEAPEYDCPRLLSSYQKYQEIDAESVLGLHFDRELFLDSEQKGIFLVQAKIRGYCNPACPGICRGGLCQEGILDENFLKDATDGFLSLSRLEKTIKIKVEKQGNYLEISPLHGSFEPERYYQLILTGGLKDEAGYPLVNNQGENYPVVIDFTTGKNYYNLPAMELVYPVKSTENPLNLAWILLGIEDEVEELKEEAFVLESENKDIINLWIQKRPGACGSNYAQCLQLFLEKELEGKTRYELRVVKKLKTKGGKVVPPWEKLGSFKTGDLTWSWPLKMENFTTEYVTGCFHLAWENSDDCLIYLENERGTRISDFMSARRGYWEMAVTHQEKTRLVAQGIDGSFFKGPWFHGDSSLMIPSVIILGEIYPNPAGKEPAQEFVEIINIGSEEVNLLNYRLTDNLEEEGDILPEFILGAGKKLVLVGNRYDLECMEDPAISQDATVLFLESSLAGGGMKNKGEELYIFDSSGKMQSRYLGWYDLSSKEGWSVNRINPEACDVSSNWYLSESTPGS
jgi:hypothetical protein